MNYGMVCLEGVFLFGFYGWALLPSSHFGTGIGLPLGVEGPHHHCRLILFSLCSYFFSFVFFFFEGCLP